MNLVEFAPASENNMSSAVWLYVIASVCTSSGIIGKDYIMRFNKIPFCMAIAIALYSRR